MLVQRIARRRQRPRGGREEGQIERAVVELVEQETKSCGLKWRDCASVVGGGVWCGWGVEVAN